MGPPLRLHQEAAEDSGVCHLPFSGGPPPLSVTPAAGGVSLPPGNSGPRLRRLGRCGGRGHWLSACGLGAAVWRAGPHAPRVQRLCYEGLSRQHCLLGGQLDSVAPRSLRWGHSSWKEWETDPFPFHCRGRKVSSSVRPRRKPLSPASIRIRRSGGWGLLDARQAGCG